MNRSRALTLTLTTLTLLAAPALALDRVAPGHDVWHTPADGKTFTSFAANPIPAGFFCPGSAPFTGRIEFRGEQILGAPAQADTIVGRLDEARFNGRGLARTRVQVRAIHLVSMEPIRTSCGAFNVRVNLAPGEQPLSLMRIRRTGEDSGTFSTGIALNVRMTFEPMEHGGTPRRLDHNITLGRSGEVPWIASQELLRQEPELLVDTNGDGQVDTRLAGHQGFYPGWQRVVREDGTGSRLVIRAAVLDDQLQAIIHELPEHGHEIEPVCQPNGLCYQDAR